MDEKINYEWESLERPYKKWSNDLFSTVVVIAFLLSVIFFFIEGLVPVLVIWSIFFMSWAINRTPPVVIAKKISSKGIYVGEDKYLYDEMKVYWIEKIDKESALKINISRFPFHLVLVIPDESVERVNKLMTDQVMYQEPKPGLMDKIIRWFRSKIDLD